MWLTLLALRNRIGILMLSLAMVVLGATSLNRLPRDLFPNIQVPVAFVGVIYKGAPPIDIEQSVVYPIEKAVSSASNVEHVESFSKHGIGAVQIWFNWGADINVGQMEVMQRITQILNNLPPGILQPFVVKFDVSNIPVAFVTVSSSNLDERALYDLAFNTIAPQIEQINNVAAATVEGGKVRQINIHLDPALLQARGLSILDVVRTVKASNLILPSGDIKAGNLDYNVFTNNQFTAVEPINDVIVKVNPQGNPVRVRDLGTVTDSSDTQTNIVRTDGQRSVYLRVNKQPTANTVEVVDLLRRALPKMVGIPPGVQLGVSFDQSVFIRLAIKNLMEQALRVRARGGHHSGLSAQPDQHADHLGGDSALDSGHVHRPVFHRTDTECLHIGRARAGSGTAGGRLDRRAGEHPASPQHRSEPLGSPAGSGARGGDADLCLDRDHRGGVSADLLRGWNRQAAADSAHVHDRHRAVHLLLHLAHGDPRALLQISQAGA